MALPELARNVLRVFRPPSSGTGDASPLFVRKGPRAVLCLHGFTGTPFEVRPLAELLAERDFTVKAPMLAGHGVDAEALDATTWKDWYASARLALDELRAEAEGRPVGVLGFSMGGLLALRLAREHPDAVAAVAVLCAPLRLRLRQARAIRVLSHVPQLVRPGPLDRLPKVSGSDTSDPEMKAKNPGLPVMPLDALASLLDLGDEVRPLLPEVRQPALVVAARQDHVVPFEDSLEIAGTLGSAVVERLWLDRSYHLVGIDVERRELGLKAARFFAEHVPAASLSRT